MDKTEGSIKGNGHHVAIHDWEPVDETGKHKSSDRIERDIEATRYTMDDIVDELSGRFNPRSYVDRAFDLMQRPENRRKAKDALVNAGNSVSESFQRNPLPVMLIAAGAAWMIWESQNRRDGRAERERAHVEESSSVEKAKERAETASETEKAQEKEKEMLTAEKMRGEGRKYQAEYQSRLGATEDKASELGRQMTGQYNKSVRGIDQAVASQPLLLGIAAVFAGLIVGLSIPSTPIERETIGEKARDTLEKAKETGERAMDRSKGIAENVSEKINEHAQEKKNESDTLNVNKTFPKKTEEKITEKVQSEAPRMTPSTPVVSETTVKLEQTKTEPVNPKVVNEAKVTERKEKGESDRNPKV